MSAMAVIVPAIGRTKKMLNEPLEISKDCRIDASAKGPSTMARTIGAIG